MTTQSELPDAIRKLREGKETLRRERRAMSLPEKVRQVVQLQEIVVRASRIRGGRAAHQIVWQLGENEVQSSEPPFCLKEAQT